MDINGAREFVYRHLSERLNPAFHYHDLSHTLDVHESVIRLAKLEQVGEKDLELLETAALFHDAGMTEQYEDHETASAGLARSVLPGFEYGPEEIDRVCGLILATKRPAGPLSLHESILCDADLDYLGRPDFFMRSFQLHVEWYLLGIRNADPVEWLESEYEYMKTHDYLTRSAQTLRGAGKEKNMRYINQFLQSIQKG